uniref:hypothetical protein n=1 Tax=uncultured Dialister sp. TaxID=278064 RepID=UPI0025DFC486
IRVDLFLALDKNPRMKSDNDLISASLDDLKSGETLYVYGVTVRLEERFGGSSCDVPIYIKVRLTRRMMDGEMVEGILISFHEQEYPLVPYFQ